MYETMRYWETAVTTATDPASVGDFADIWRGANKIVYSRTLESVSSAKTRIERDFDVEAVRAQKATSARDLTVGGPDLAGQAINAGLVDELRLFAVPIVLGGGKPWLPDGVRISLELTDLRRFASGVVYLSYRPK
jgi:dihydrofolate reductase